MENHSNPSAGERREIIAAAAAIFKQRFYSPTLGGLDLDGALAECMPKLLATDAFAADSTAVFARSGAKPIEVFHESERKVALARFLKATLLETPERDYLFRDVLVGGRARQDGIESGDRLISVNGKQWRISPSRCPVRKIPVLPSGAPFPLTRSGSQQPDHPPSYGPETRILPTQAAAR